MQGRITKVLNMKPPEILAMIEEAAGTRMYEAKKQAVSWVANPRGFVCLFDSFGPGSGGC